MACAWPELNNKWEVPWAINASTSQPRSIWGRSNCPFNVLALWVAEKTLTIFLIFPIPPTMITNSVPIVLVQLCSQAIDKTLLLTVSSGIMVSMMQNNCGRAHKAGEALPMAIQFQLLSKCWGKFCLPTYSSEKKNNINSALHRKTFRGLCMLRRTGGSRNYEEWTRVNLSF